MEDEELNLVLQVLENPVRRKIVKRLSRGSSYPLRLSKELGLGQPLVAKHLAIMEKAGIVSSSMKKSPGGPDRRSYSLAKSVSVTLDLGPNLFIQHGFAFGSVTGKDLSDEASSLLGDVSRVSRDDERAIHSLATILERVDNRLDGLEGERATLLYVRNLALSTALQAISTVKDEAKRRVIYSVLERHGWKVFGHGRAAVAWLIDDIRLPAVANEIFRPTIAPIRCTDETSSGSAAAVNEDNGSLMGRLCGNEILNVHRVRFRSGKEITFGEGYRLRSRGIARDRRHHSKDENESVKFQRWPLPI